MAHPFSQRDSLLSTFLLKFSIVRSQYVPSSLPFPTICPILQTVLLLFIFSILLAWLAEDLMVIVVQLLSRVLVFATTWTIAHQAPLSFTISWNWFKLMSIESVMPSNYLILSFLVPFFSFLQLFPDSGSFPMSWLLASGGQSKFLFC